MTPDDIKRLSISTEDFLCLRGAVANRDRNLQLSLDQTDEG
jgi:hypothetical protein